MDEDILLKIWDLLAAFWRFRVTTIDNNDITIANIIIALIVFLVGFKISRKVSSIVSKNAYLAIKDLNANSRSIIESVTFYFLVIIFTFTALSVAQIPLKTFALLGGALAIGFGFGSQNIIKNFISGVILMIEMPIRVGDIITVEGSDGKIEKIGARSTHIKTFDNVDILVPNSTLLENNVINWTLSDNFVRTRILVGVAYGSDTRKVERLLIQSTKNNDSILSDRPVMVFFNEFGDNALNFEMQFWCLMNRPSDRRIIESNIRHDINELFAKEGICISFPQRDVHLDTLSPLEIKVVK